MHNHINDNMTHTLRGSRNLISHYKLKINSEILCYLKNNLLSQFKPATEWFRPVGTHQYGPGTIPGPCDYQPKLLTSRPKNS
jgi:hypothetical protein